MYSLQYFKEKDESVIKEFIRQYSFATLIANADPYPAATQIPLLVEEREGRLFLKGHIMRQTDHHKALEKNQNVLCVFTGPHAYVSASWYTAPQVASTWNYMTVQITGTLTFLGEEDLLKILQETTEHYEQNSESPASYHHLPKEYIDRLAKAIVGFEIEVQTMEHVFKLSQNRDETSYNNIIRQLEKGDGASAGISEQMKQRSAQLFDK